MLGRIASFLALSLALLSQAASAAKVPKTLCLGIGPPGIQLVLTMKKVGSATTAAGKQTYYQIAGEVSFTVVHTSVPVVGSGHLAGDVLHFAVSGSDLREDDSYFSASHYEGKWDVAQRSGSISELFLWEAGGAQALSDVGSALGEIACQDVLSFY